MDLQIRKLSKTYANGVRALKEATLTIPPGMYGLLTPRACEEDWVTAELIARLATLLRRKGQARGRALKDFRAALE